MYPIYNWPHQAPPPAPPPLAPAPALAAPHYLVADAIDDAYDHSQPPPPPPPPPGYAAPPASAVAAPYAIDYHYQPPPQPQPAPAPPPYYAPYPYGYPQRLTVPAYGGTAPLEEQLPQQASNFKPIQTKKNLKPRINKIVKGLMVLPPTTRRRAPRKLAPVVVGEVVNDDVFDHYAREMGLSRPLDATVLALCQLRLKLPLEFALFDTFCATIQPALDVYLPHRVWGLIIPEIALYDDTNVVLDAVLCLALMVYARQPLMATLIAPLAPEIAVKYHQRAVALIEQQLPRAADDYSIMARAMVATVVLCIYETFLPPLDASYVDSASVLLFQLVRRPELRGGRSGRPPGLERLPLYQLCFTMLMVCDVYQALKQEQPCWCPSDQFWQALDPDMYEGLDDYSRGQAAPDAPMVAAATGWWLLKLVHLLGVINDFRCLPLVLLYEDYECNRPLQTWRQLQRQLTEFDAQYPQGLAPIVYQWDPLTLAFPTIYFRSPAHAIVYLHRKMAHLCLYEALQRRPHRDDGAAAAELDKLGADHPQRLAREIFGVFSTYDGNPSMLGVMMPCLRLVTAHLGDTQLAQQMVALAERQPMVGAVARSVCRYSE
ncbi:hypothetical protein JNB11_08940 [Kocuria palustris]|nr:hypothetical protein [Kocuria palustris]